jgi:hypothetical protein
VTEQRLVFAPEWIPARPARRPWWWWLALIVAIALALFEGWLSYRAIAGWPVGVSLLSRVAG